MQKVFWLVPMIMALFLLGCGQAPSQSTQIVDGTIAPVLEELTIALDWVPNTNHTGLYVALEQGFFAKQGFDVKIVQPSEDSSSKIVAAGRADLGIYFQPNMVKRLKKGEPITAIAAIAQQNTAGLLAPASLGATSPKDLHGLRYSTWEDPVDDAVVASLVGTPLNPVPGETTDAATAFKLNQFDFILAYYGWDGVNAKLKGLDTSFFYLKDANPTFNYYSPVIIANSNELAAHPDKYKKALAAIKDGYVFAAKNPKQSADMLLKHAPETNKELVYASQEYLSPYYLDETGDWGRFDYGRWDRFFTWVYEQGLVDEPFAPQAGVTNDYLPNG